MSVFTLSANLRMTSCLKITNAVMLGGGMTFVKLEEKEEIFQNKYLVKID